MLDLIVAGSLAEPPRAAPPAAPVAGDCFIVAAGATGDWAGRDGQLAGFTPGGWRFLAPVEGMRLQLRTTGETASFRGGAWEIGVERVSAVRVGGQQVVGPRTAAIAGPAGGATVDVEARAAVSAILAALRGHGLIAG